MLQVFLGRCSKSSLQQNSRFSRVRPCYDTLLSFLFIHSFSSQYSNLGLIIFVFHCYTTSILTTITCPRYFPPLSYWLIGKSPFLPIAQSGNRQRSTYSRFWAKFGILSNFPPPQSFYRFAFSGVLRFGTFFFFFCLLLISSCMYAIIFYCVYLQQWFPFAPCTITMSRRCETECNEGC